MSYQLIRLTCPACGGSLTAEDGRSLKCAHCGSRFLLVQNDDGVAFEDDASCDLVRSKERSIVPFSAGAEQVADSFTKWAATDPFASRRTRSIKILGVRRYRVVIYRMTVTYDASVSCTFVFGDLSAPSAAAPYTGIHQGVATICVPSVPWLNIEALDLSAAAPIGSDAEARCEVLPAEIDPETAYYRYGAASVREEAIGLARLELHDRADEFRGLTIGALDVDSMVCKDVLYPVWEIDLEIDGRETRYHASGADAIRIAPVQGSEGDIRATSSTGPDQGGLGFAFACSLLYMFLFMLWTFHKVFDEGPDLSYVAVSLVGALTNVSGLFLDDRAASPTLRVQIISAAQTMFWLMYIAAPIASVAMRLFFGTPLPSLTEGLLCLVPGAAAIDLSDRLISRRNAAPLASIRVRIIELSEHQTTN